MSLEALESCAFCMEGSLGKIDEWYGKYKVYIESPDISKWFTETFISQNRMDFLVGELFNTLKLRFTLLDDKFCELQTLVKLLKKYFLKLTQI